MAVRVIELRRIQCTDGDCGVALEYTEYDIKPHKTSCMGESDIKVGILCPLCRQIIGKFELDKNSVLLTSADPGPQPGDVDTTEGQPLKELGKCPTCGDPSGTLPCPRPSSE